ncbi:sensor histidine kinase [Paenibacillus sp. CAA11]|uniref:sensor histidine kinase n=1 Tax=Paenibacillus sp. CAA11 TaxID=1532905 RepID=UPI00131F328C|nr:sensor histidine kinase [Paenibacillus sp. CAA11]
MNDKGFKAEHIDELLASRLPVLIWVSIVYIATVIMQFLIDPLIFQSAVFTGLFIIHGALHWNSFRISRKYFWIYILVQEILIYLCAILMREAYQPVLIGLLPVLIAQSLSISFRIKRILFVSLASLIVFFDAALTVGEREELHLLFPFFTLMLIVVMAYAVLFFRQVQERLRIQSFLHDLQEAHKKVEELTLSNERQRMARDLHDTLAQGVAGITMQLEAVDAHMTQGNLDRAQSIIKLSMQQARRTLADARKAIDNLRLKSSSEIDFKEAIQDEVQHFKDSTGIPVFTDIQLTKRSSRLIMEHSLHIIKESLTNIARHAQANAVRLRLFNEKERLFIQVIDDGIGFNIDDIGKDVGHYGLLGIQERARLIGGEVSVTSSSEGTTITVDVPFVEGEMT